MQEDLTGRQIRAIPTQYLGIEFRSRREARWAVFFQTLSISWEYEPEGYELEGGVKYLPDFWLADQNAFWEVKGIEQNVGAKPGLLALALHKRVFVHFGPVAPHEFWPRVEVALVDKTDSAHVFYGDPDYPGPDDTNYYWCQCPSCGKLDLQFEGRAHRIDCFCNSQHQGDRGHNPYSAPLAEAYEAARTQRFWR